MKPCRESCRKDHPKGDDDMTEELFFSICHVLIHILGTISLIVLAFGGTLYFIVWFFRTYWKFLVAAGVAVTLTALLIFILPML